ncbi:MAG: ABC transporter substrate-binding protein [Arcobacteraceae bacterium]|nr:ABC transporter substrate-binding protein [Arcobacteraceae bacterium]
MIKKILILAALIFNLNATEVDDLNLTFTNKTNTVVDIVKCKLFTSEERNDKIIEAITPMFDFQLMAKLSLGKKWKSLNETKQAEFIKLYVHRMKKSYSAKIDKYTDETIIINKITQIKKTRIVLNSSLISKDEKVEVIYKYHKPKKQIENKDKWLVYDVIIAGVSIVKTDKAQFKAVLRESSIETLMDKIR